MWEQRCRSTSEQQRRRLAPREAQRLFRFRQGVGAGLHQHIDPEHLDGFVATFTAPYKKLVEQPLYYGDGPVPEGKIRATLSQSKQRGFGVGSVLLAKKILARSTQKPAHPQ